MPVDFWRQARYYFFLYAVLGLVSPYLGYWLSNTMDEGMKYAMATFYSTMIFVPVLWGHAAFTPRAGQLRPGQWLTFASLGAAVFSLGLTQISPDLPVLTACFLVLAFGLFFNALVALVESISYVLLDSPADFSRIRVFGSIGFLVCSVALGGTIVFSHPWTFPYLLAAIMTVAWVQSTHYKRLILPSPPATPNQVPKSLPRSAMRLWALWGVVAMTQAAFACYFTFFALRLRDLGFSGIMIGVLIGVASAAEIFMFLRLGPLVARYSARALIIFSTLLTVVRWVVLSLVTGPSWWPVVVLAQMSQAFGFSVFHVSCMRVLRQNSPTVHFGALRGISEAVGFGLGAAAGVLMAGTLWEGGRHAGVFLLAAFLAFVSCVFACFLPKNEEELPHERERNAV